MRRLPSHFIAPDANPNDGIMAAQYDGGALVEMIEYGTEARWQTTKILQKPALRTPPNGTLSFTTYSPTTLNRIKFGNGVFVAITGAQEVAASSDGVNWTYTGLVPTSGDLADLIFTGSQFVVVSTATSLFTSSDGVNWTQTDSLPNYLMGGIGIRTIGYNGSVYVAFGDVGYMWHSTGIGGPWTEYGPGFYVVPNYVPFKVINFNGTFIALTSGGTDLPTNSEMARSSDGISWTTINLPGQYSVVDAATDGTNVVVVGASGNVWSSLDAVNWIRHARVGGSIGSTNFVSLTYHQGYWAAGTNVGSVRWSYGNWTLERATAGEIGGSYTLRSIAAGLVGGQHKFILGGGGVGTIVAASNGAARLEYPRSADGSVPQVYDPASDLIYAWETRYAYNNADEFYRVAVRVLAIDPRSKTIVRSRDLWVRNADDYSALNSASRLWLQGDELLLELSAEGNGFRYYTINKNDFTDVCYYDTADDFAQFHYPANGGFFKYTWASGGITATLHSRSITNRTGYGLTPTFSLQLTSPLITINLPQAPVHIVDPDGPYVWFVSTRIADNGTLNQQSAYIAARWNTTTNTVTYINKPAQLFPPGSTNYNCGKALQVVNGLLVFGIERYGYKATLVVDAAGPTVSIFGEDINNGQDPGFVRFSPNGRGFAIDGTDYGLCEFTLNTPSALHHTFFFLGGSGTGRLTVNGQDLYASPYDGPFTYNGDEYYGAPIPANARVVSPPVYNRTPPAGPYLTTIDPPPALDFGSVLTGDLELPYAGDNSYSSISWVKLTHDGITTKLITFLNPTDSTTNTTFSGPVGGIIYAALYTSGGRLIGRTGAAEMHYHQAGTTKRQYDNSMKQEGMVLLGSAPAGDYFIGVLPSANVSYHGRTLFSDFDFDGFSSDKSSLTNGGVTQKFRVRVQLFPGTYLFNFSVG